MAWIISGVLILIFSTCRYPLVGLFSTEAEVIDKAVIIMLIMCLIMPFQMTQIVVSGSLRGAGDTRYVANTMLMCVMVIRPLMTWLCIYPLALGVIGAWTGMLVDQCIRVTMVYRRFLGGRWANIKV